MRDFPVLVTVNPPPTLLAAWESKLHIANPEARSKEGRKCCPPSFVNCLSDLKQATFRVDGLPGTIFNSSDGKYRLDVQRRGQMFTTLAIQTNGQNSKTVRNLYISREDVRDGWIGTTCVKEAFRHMFKTRKWKNGGHLTVFRDERPESESKGDVVFLYGRPTGGA